MISWCDFDTDEAVPAEPASLLEIARKLAGFIKRIGGLSCRGR